MPLLEIDDARWQRMIDVNLTGVFLSVQEAARAMAASDGGAIVVTSSTNAFYVEQHTSHYSATKGGVLTSCGTPRRISPSTASGSTRSAPESSAPASAVR